MKLLSTLTSVGLGAALVYFLDPVSGNRRRALIRDKANRTAHDARHFFEVARRDLQNRSFGMMEEMRSRLAGQRVDDDRLVRRVAAKIGHHMTHVKDVGITAEDGIVTLRGPIMSHEVEQVLRVIGRIPGVKEIRNQLEVREVGEGMLQRPLRKKWTPARRFAVGSAGLILAASTRNLMRGRRRA